MKIARDKLVYKLRPQIINIVEWSIMTEVPSVIGNETGVIRHKISKSARKAKDSSSSSSSSSSSEDNDGGDGGQTPNKKNNNSLVVGDIDRSLAGLLEFEGNDIYGHFPSCSNLYECET